MPLQRAQNAAARLVLGLDRRSSITAALRDLHWLPVKHRITFKVATLMHQALHRRCPAYLADLVAFSSTDRLSLAAPLHYDQSSRDTENSDPIRKTGFLCLWSRRVEQSSSICLHRRLQLVLPPCCQLICSSLRLTINCFYFIFYHFINYVMHGRPDFN